MIIINAEELAIHIKAPDKEFMIKASEVQEIHRHVKMAGGSEVVRNRVLKILADIVERTGRT